MNENKKCCKNSIELIDSLTPVFSDFFGKLCRDDFNFSQVLSKFSEGLNDLGDGFGVSRKNEDGKYQLNINVDGYTPDEITIELNRCERTVTVEASHEVNDKSSEGSSYHNSRHMKVVETIPESVDIYSVRKEFNNNQLVITGNNIQEMDESENIVKL